MGLGGVGSTGHVSGALFGMMAGVKIAHVQFIADETEKWGKVVKFSGAKPD